MVIRKNPIQPVVLSMNNKLGEMLSLHILVSWFYVKWSLGSLARNNTQNWKSQNHMKLLLSCLDLKLPLKQRIVSCYVHATLLYVVETWTLSEAIERRIQAFEMWIFRISWVDRFTNKEVLSSNRRWTTNNVCCQKLKIRILYWDSPEYRSGHGGKTKGNRNSTDFLAC